MMMQIQAGLDERVPVPRGTQVLVRGRPSGPLLLLTALWLLPSMSPGGLHTWTGANSGFWSDPLNWTGGPPQPGELAPVRLVFPDSAPAHREITNDLSSLVVNELVLHAHANTLYATTGVVIRLENATLAGLGTATILDDSFRLELAGTNDWQGGSDFVLRGPIGEAVPGASLSIHGNVRLEASSTHSGPTRLSAGLIYLFGSMTNTSFIEISTNAEVTLAADFSMLTNKGRLHISPEAMERPETSRLFGHGLICHPGSTTTVAMIDYPALDSTDPADGGRLHSRLMIDGPVVLAGRLETTTDLFQDGLRFSIIENLGGEDTLGQFEQMPEGALTFIGADGLMTQRIGYRGGAGQHVTLTFVLPPSGRKLAGPWLLENGWLQVLGGVAEFEEFALHRWEATTNLTDRMSWTSIGDGFTPVTDGTILTITNGADHPQRYFRLAVP